MTDEDRTATAIEQARTDRRLCLLVVHDSHLATYPLPAHGRVVIGRSREADLQLDLKPVSRRHIILHIGESIALEDCGSSNGTRVRDTMVPPNTTVIVAPGDPIELGSVLLVIQRVATAGDPAPRLPAPARSTMATLDKLVTRIAAGEINVLLHGETGVGKERFAERIHAGSVRNTKPLLRLNCAALAESLLVIERLDELGLPRPRKR